MKRFTSIEDQYIREHYATHTLKQMGDAIGRSEGSICGRMKRLGLVVPLEEQERRRKYTNINLTIGGIATRICKGNVPANKGKQMSDEMRQLLRPTMFKPGNVPANHKAVGSERIDKDGYVWMKVAEPNVWKMKHRVEWEKFHGKLEKGDIIKFIDGKKTNTFIENLRLTNRIGNMHDNTIQNYPPELRKAVQSLGVMKRRINTISKQIKPQDNEQ